MKRVIILIFLLLASLISACGLFSQATGPAAACTATPPSAGSSWPAIAPASGQFDYYVLALSWAPDYCSSNPGDTQECSLGRKYAFVLHGLWPQYHSGYPLDCSRETMPESVKAQFPHLYPIDKLFDHEWSKHGTCTGLSPLTYLTLAKQLKDQVAVPEAYRAPSSPFRTTTDELKHIFLQANPSLTDAGLAVYCSGSGKYLSQIEFCVSKDGQPAECGADVAKSALKSCANGDFLVRNVR